RTARRRRRPATQRRDPGGAGGAHRGRHVPGQVRFCEGTVGEFTGLVTKAERALGPEDINVLALRRYLAYWKDQAGRRADAVADLEPLLVDAEAALSPGASFVEEV